MKSISVIDRIEHIRESAVEAENFKLAKELAAIQLDIIEERSREWSNGFDAGFALAKGGGKTKADKVESE